MLEPNQVFAARYRVIRRLAEGGMGAVFECEHTGTEARVALKLLWPHVLGVASAREKFELEAKVAARVASEHIVQVLDAGFDEESRSPYLVMELLSGDTLSAWVRREGPLAPHVALRLMGQVASGLDAAHGYVGSEGARMPIVHRDLKPENLFVTRRSDGSTVMKILDFGIAKVVSESTEVSQEVRGTPLYMACEQINAARVSPQTDIWAFGLITYYALTGRRYWRSANSAEAGVQSLFAEILTLPMEPPSQRLRDLGVNAPLPVAFDEWFLKCIHREPEQRFASAGEAMAELERALDGASVTALEAPPVGGPSASGTPKEGSLASVPGVVSERARSLTSPMSSGRWLWPAMGVGVAAVVVLGWLAFSEAFGTKASVTAASTAVGSDPDTEAAARSVGHSGTPNPPTVRAAAPAGPDAGVGPFRSRKVAPRVRPIEEPADSETVDTAVDNPGGERSSLRVPFRIRRTLATPEPPATLTPQRPQATLPPKRDLTPARPPSKVIDPYATR